MIKRPFAVIAALLFAGIALCSPSVSLAADDAASATPAAHDAKAELDALVDKVNIKIKAGKKSEKDYADELKQCDAILAEHKGEKTDDVANVLALKAELYSQVILDDAKALPLFKQLKTDYPDTDAGMSADRMIAQMAKLDEAQKALDALLPNGSKFPDFDVKDLDGKPLSVANYKGKVVLVDFWATWCPPCRDEMPNIVNVYQKYHDKGFEIIGVSGDGDLDALKAFIIADKMPWPQYQDGGDGKISEKYDMAVIPNNILIGRDGKIIAKTVRGDALGEAVAKALKK